MTTIARFLILSLLILSPLSGGKLPYFKLDEFDQGIFTKIEKIHIGNINNAFNPTMVSFGENILVAFRHIPNMDQPWVNYIGLILLDWDFNPITEIKLLNLRKSHPKIPSRAEDPRLITHNGQIFLFYNDNLDQTNQRPGPRREMYMVEIVSEENSFSCKEPILLKHPTNYPNNEQEKNWTPFSTESDLLISYTLNPHEVLLPSLNSGHCTHLVTTSFNENFLKNTSFRWGHLRGGTVPLLMGDHYLAFFHSFTVGYSTAAKFSKTYHYFMGAYTFSATPPYEILSMSPHPLMCQDLFTPSSYNKRVAYPGGFLHDSENIYLIYGKDDKEIWMATLDRSKLLNSLESVKNK